MGKQKVNCAAGTRESGLGQKPAWAVCLLWNASTGFFKIRSHVSLNLSMPEWKDYSTLGKERPVFS